MALDTNKIMVGVGVFSIGDYVTAGGAGSLTDIGTTKTPFELAPSFENYDEETERVNGIVKTVPIKDGHTLKVSMHQAEAELLRIALGQPAGNKSGTGDDLTLLVGDRAEQYHQATLVTVGPGTTGVRTLTFWKLQVASVDAIQVGKTVAQMYVATFRVMRDGTLATADKYFKQVDA